MLTAEEVVGKVTDDGCAKNEQEMYKLRADFYKGTINHAIHMVTEMVAYTTDTTKEINGHGLGREAPLMLIDSGASRSVCGRKWAEWWFESSFKVEFGGESKTVAIWSRTSIGKPGYRDNFYSRETDHHQQRHPDHHSGKS